MGRSQFKHPALAQQQLQKDLALKDEEDLDSIPGWDRFSPVKKQLLTVMPWFADATTAYRYITDNPDAKSSAVQDLRRNDREFAHALDYRRGSSNRMVRNLGADMLGKAMLRLNYYIDADLKDVPAREQLKAIEMVMNMNHIDSSAASPSFNSYADVINFNMPAPAQPEPRSIDNVIVVEEDVSVT